MRLQIDIPFSWQLMSEQELCSSIYQQASSQGVQLGYNWESNKQFDIREIAIDIRDRLNLKRCTRIHDTLIFTEIVE